MSTTDLDAAAESGDDPVVADSVARRAAMKAALGGAAAAAVWSAPRIEGLSLAPDYAAAASCTGGSMGEQSHNSNNCDSGTTECWGNNCCGTFNWDQQIVASRFTWNGSLAGNVNTDSGNVSVNVNGIDPPFQRCTVNVSGNCNNGGSFRGGGSLVFNNNGNQNSFVDCQGGGGYYQDDPDGTIRVNMTCVCL